MALSGESYSYLSIAVRVLERIVMKQSTLTMNELTSIVARVLTASDGLDAESNRDGKMELKRIVSMLTRPVQRTQTVSEGSVEYEYEYEHRDGEYEFEAARIAECQTIRCFL